MYSVCCCSFWPEEEVLWRRGPSLTYCGPALDLPLGGFGSKVNANVRGHEYLISTKFDEYPSSDSEVKVDYGFRYIYMHYAPPSFHLNK